MNSIDELEIGRSILDTHHKKLQAALRSDVLIVGAGPAGLMAAAVLAGAGLRVTLFEKRLAVGGGIWGGGMGMNHIVVQDQATGILDSVGVSHRPTEHGLHVGEAIELACGLGLAAMRAGAIILNLMTVEDLCFKEDRVCGVVVNRSLLGESWPIDPIVFHGRAVVDATGHEAALVRLLTRRGNTAAEVRGEGTMDADAGERFVVDHTGEICPGLWIAGMAVCATHGGARMGPIFGGMLLSGRSVAEMILDFVARDRLKGSDR